MVISSNYYANRSIIRNMAFKENLKIELDYKGMKVKELAFSSGVNKRTLDQYLSSAAKMPSAENAVKIATALGVSVEYLVTGKDINPQNQKNFSDELQDHDRLYKKYHTLIQKVEKLSKDQIAALENFLGML